MSKCQKLLLVALCVMCSIGNHLGAQATNDGPYLPKVLEARAVMFAMRSVVGDEAMLVASDRICLAERPEPECPDPETNALMGPRLPRNLYGRLVLEFSLKSKTHGKAKNDSPLARIQRPSVMGDSIRMTLVVQRVGPTGARDTVAYDVIMRVQGDTVALVAKSERAWGSN